MSQHAPTRSGQTASGRVHPRPHPPRTGRGNAHIDGYTMERENKYVFLFLLRNTTGSHLSGVSRHLAVVGSATGTVPIGHFGILWIVRRGCSRNAPVRMADGWH
jgi:hypothetical protein